VPFPHLGDLAALDITAVELMPVAQFPGERNWGYDGVYPFAAQNSYGGPQRLKRFVNACHAPGTRQWCWMLFTTTSALREGFVYDGLYSEPRKRRHGNSSQMARLTDVLSFRGIPAAGHGFQIDDLKGFVNQGADNSATCL
jgi:hypothetical protein